MPLRILICGFALVEYIGDGEYKRVGSTLQDSAILTKGDFFVVDRATAVALGGGTRFKWHRDIEDCDILKHFSTAKKAAAKKAAAKKAAAEASSDEASGDDASGDGDANPPQEDAQDTGDGGITVASLMAMEMEDLKKLCKSKKIKYGKLSRGEMVGALMPILGL